jgi:DNA-binding transcriptional MerR regulator
VPDGSRKSDQAFRTIGELADELGVPQHILRYWETRFPQLRPLQRAGNRRYYRPTDVALAQRIHRLLNQDGYTIRGVQHLLAGGGDGDDPGPAVDQSSQFDKPASSAEALRRLRRTLRDALDKG